MNARFEYLLRLGDDALILGQQLGLWTGHGPVLEEDIALTNIGLDQIGQARAWLTLAGRAENANAMKSRWPFTATNPNSGTRNCVKGPMATLATPLSVNSYLTPTLSLCTLRSRQSNDAEIAAIARKSAKESAYHLRHSSAWMVRLGDGTEESHAKVQESLDVLLPFAGDLFHSDAVARTAATEGWGVDPANLREAWEHHLVQTLTEAGLKRPEPAPEQCGGRIGRHTEGLSFLLAEMQVLPRTYPDAKW